MDVLARSTTERRDPPVRRRIRSDRSVQVSPIILVRIEGVTTAFLLLALGPDLELIYTEYLGRDGRREPTEIRLHPGHGFGPTLTGPITWILRNKAKNSNGRTQP